ncbi:MAG TPA: TolC family protein [Kofleriaceae bacterium]|nr:TolC family protein [Kofleriaceae bacterium]
MRGMHVIAAVAALATSVRADPDAATELDLEAYLAAVGRSNLSLAAQRYTISAAEAQIGVARLFPEPQLTAGVASFDLARSGAPTVLELGASHTFELGGKRHGRIAVAERAVTGARHDLDDFQRTLRGQAADAFVDALGTRLVMGSKQRTLASLTRLVEKNEDRHRSGDIGELPVTQARVEAERFRGDVLVAQSEVHNAELGLGGFAGSARRISPRGDLEALASRAFDASALIEAAKAHRPDVRSARAAVELARAKQGLAIANRRADLTVGIGYSHSSEAAGSYATIAPTPSTDMVSATLSVPIPIARWRYRGELDAAIAAEGQAEAQLRAAELKVEVEIRQALARYQATVDRRKLYTGGILTDAVKVLDATTYNYTRGGGTLLEVIEAQRTVDDVYLAYYQALADHAHALISVELAAGIWDLKL